MNSSRKGIYPADSVRSVLKTEESNMEYQGEANLNEAAFKRH